MNPPAVSARACFTANPMEPISSTRSPFGDCPGSIARQSCLSPMATFGLRASMDWCALTGELNLPASSLSPSWCAASTPASRTSSSGAPPSPTALPSICLTTAIRCALNSPLPPMATKTEPGFNTGWKAPTRTGPPGAGRKKPTTAVWGLAPIDSKSARVMLTAAWVKKASTALRSSPPGTGRGGRMRCMSYCCSPECTRQTGSNAAG